MNRYLAPVAAMAAMIALAAPAVAATRFSGSSRPRIGRRPVGPISVRVRMISSAAEAALRERSL